ncbi:hypothetical protein LOTGIDRAFT_235923 [Lottia gigantea]|uniref:Uncharacterized protein n=1 Tax=Lottia gigantea TaxID=225164 RepID=V3ZR67_LOTGI|nr:hypothetical protein LOTGIDRAFT_235923 [Lottia gigantea]ESO85050.1 hypothetical protein LOTGIDRAFT_235923 [Lottia gigantea]
MVPVSFLSCSSPLMNLNKLLVTISAPGVGTYFTKVKMLINIICRHWWYWFKLISVAVISLLIINSMTILDNYDIITVPASTDDKQTRRIAAKDNWIIMDNTDININHMKLLDDRQDWSALVMDTTKSRKTLKCNNCRSRESMDGVLEAIKNNAKFIYYSDNAFTVEEELPKLKLTPLFYGMDYTGNASSFNIEAHFKNSHKASAVSQNLNSHYRLGGLKTPMIQTFVPEEMLLNAGESTENIDKQAPPIILPKDYYHPFSLKGTLYFYDTFWALAPVDMQYYTVWSMMIEKLLEELASEVGFMAPRKARSLVRYEQMNTQKILEITTVLNQWICLPGAPFFKCIELLSYHMTTAGQFPDEASGMIKNFIKTLTRVGYKEPARVFPNLPRPFVPPLNQIIYWPAARVDRSLSKMNMSIAPMCVGGTGTCQEVGRTNGGKIPTYDNLLLVVVFNRPGHYGVVDYLERMYRPFFPQMIYCGHDMNNFLSIYNLLNKKLSFIEVDFNLGQYGYECLQKAMQMNFDVDGYIHLSDDVLLNVWNVAELPKDKLWFQKNMRIAHFIMHVVPDIWKHPHWGPWTTVYGRTAAKAAIASLINLSYLETRAKEFMFMLSTNVGGFDRVYYEASDIFYVPKRFAQDFIYFASVFDAAHVHLEIAVPTIFNGLDLNENIVTMNGSYLWYQDRNLYQLKYNYKDIYMHSMKLAPCIADATCQKFICQRYIPCLYSS